MCLRNERTIADLQSQLHKHSQQTLSIHEKDSMSTGYHEKSRAKKTDSARKDSKPSCVALVESIRRKLVR